MIEDRHKVVERAWGVDRASRSQWENVMQEQIPPGTDAPDDKAVIQNQDLEHQRETHVSNKGVKVPAPMVDSPSRRDVEEEEQRLPETGCQSR
jgi:hypothetical protein